jgi:hypothetical protein
VARVVLLQILGIVDNLYASARRAFAIVELIAQAVHHLSSAAGGFGARALADSADHLRRDGLEKRPTLPSGSS